MQSIYQEREKISLAFPYTLPRPRRQHKTPLRNLLVCQNCRLRRETLGKQQSNLSCRHRRESANREPLDMSESQESTPLLSYHMETSYIALKPRLIMMSQAPNQALPNQPPRASSRPSHERWPRRARDQTLPQASRRRPAVPKSSVLHRLPLSPPKQTRLPSSRLSPRPPPWQLPCWQHLQSPKGMGQWENLRKGDQTSLWEPK